MKKDAASAAARAAGRTKPKATETLTRRTRQRLRTQIPSRDLGVARPYPVFDHSWSDQAAANGGGLVCAAGAGSFAKKALDRTLATAALAVLSPLLLLIAIAIKLESRGPVLFRQQRHGQNLGRFTIYKFRSMKVHEEQVGQITQATKDDDRITAVGRFIRRTSIDELPQLFNILRGDMSVVGPRPAIPKQVELVEMRRNNGALTCTPGLTGLAQIKSYNGMPETVKAQFDGDYSAKITFLSDISIILRTFAYLLKPPPVY